MPLYEYKCVCGHTFDTVRTMRDESVEKCPKCQGEDTARVPSLAHTDMKAFHTPIEMFSIAMEDPDEIREFKQRNPDIICSDDPDHPDYGLPIAANRKQKMQALETAKFVETN